MQIAKRSDKLHMPMNSWLRSHRKYSWSAIGSATIVPSKQQARHKGFYDRKCRGATLDVGNLVLVKQTAWKGRHKIQDCWEEEEYQVVDQPTPGVPVYVVKSIAGGRPRVLHRNLLVPLQGRMRQDGTTGEESNPDSDSEGEASETLKATRGGIGGQTPLKRGMFLHWLGCPPLSTGQGMGTVVRMKSV